MGRAAVVGAGLSGLTAAYRLQQAGWATSPIQYGADFMSAGQNTAVEFGSGAARDLLTLPSKETV
jgi:glycine/D-amino acid oxidase-like deaminating enzyme